jgi:hypothetical protein
VIVRVEYGIVLDRAVLAYDDVAVVGSNHGARPDAGPLPDDHVADDVGCFANEDGRVYPGAFSI